MAGRVVLLVLVLAVGGFVIAVWLYHVRFCRSAPTFRCKVHRAGRLGQPQSWPWPCRRSRAGWVHDVLLLKRGVLSPRVTALPVHMPDEALRSPGRGEVRRLGGDPQVFLLRLDDDTLVEVAAHSEDRDRLVGPFLAAAIPGLPGGPGEQPNLGG